MYFDLSESLSKTLKRLSIIPPKKTKKQNKKTHRKLRIYDVQVYKKTTKCKNHLNLIL